MTSYACAVTESLKRMKARLRVLYLPYIPRSHGIYITYIYIYIYIFFFFKPKKSKCVSVVT